MTIPSVLPTSTLMAPTQFEANLSPDGLMIYLSTRLNGLDDQINSFFNTEQRQADVQKALRDIQTELAKLDEHTSAPNDVLDLPDRDPNAPAHQDVVNADGTVGASPAERNINAAIDEIRKVDPLLADDINKKLNEHGFILWVQDGKFTGAEVTATKEYITGLQKDIESSAQMNMIRLQSLMSSRQTAIQLSTNLIASLGDSTKAIVTNVGK